jgi:type IV pilus assembly protein PilV
MSLNFNIIRIERRGFSLLEALIALLILAFSMLGLSFVMLSTIETNRDARRVTAASNLALDQLEVLRGTAYTGVVNGSNGPLTEDGASSGTGAMYTPTWTVADDTPVTSTKTVQVVASRTDKSGSRVVCYRRS